LDLQGRGEAIPGQEIAECSKSHFFGDYKVRVFNNAEVKLMMCVFIALNLLEHQSTSIADLF
jgi:hypothetical protein